MEIINVDFLGQEEYESFQPFCNTDMLCPITSEGAPGGGSGGGGWWWFPCQMDWWCPINI